MIGLIVRIYCFLRFGTVTELIKSVDGGCVSEIQFSDRNGDVVGYWAYGSFDPALPFGELCCKYAKVK